MPVNVTEQQIVLTAIDRVSAVFAGVERSIGSVTSEFGKLAAIGGAAGAIGGFVGLIKNAIDLGDATLKMSEKLGMSVEQVSKLQFAFHLANVDADKFKAGMKGFEVSLIAANDTTTKSSRLFRALGVDIAAGPAEAFRQFAEAFSKLPEGQLRAAVATEILKKAGLDMIPGLVGGAKALDDAGVAAQKLGIVMSTDFAKQADEFNQKLKQLETGSTRLGIALANPLLSPLIALADRMGQASQKGNIWAQAFQEINNNVAVLITSLHELLGIKLNPQLEAAFEHGFQIPKDPTSGKIKGSQTCRVDP